MIGSFLVIGIKDWTFRLACSFCRHFVSRLVISACTRKRIKHIWLINNTKSMEIKQTLGRYRPLFFAALSTATLPFLSFSSFSLPLPLPLFFATHSSFFAFVDSLSAPLRKRQIILAVRSPHCATRHATLHYLYLVA